MMTLVIDLAVHGVCDHPAQALGRLTGLVFRGTVHEQGEFLPANACGHLVTTRHALDDGAKAAKHGVSDAMPELVVHTLEVVEIKDDQRKRFAVALEPPCRLGQRRLEILGVVEPGQPIVESVLALFFFASAQSPAKGREYAAGAEEHVGKQSRLIGQRGQGGYPVNGENEQPAQRGTRAETGALQRTGQGQSPLEPVLHLFHVHVGVSLGRDSAALAGVESVSAQSTGRLLIHVNTVRGPLQQTGRRLLPLRDPTMTDSAQSTVVYNDKVIQQFAVMTLVWGIVGMTVGVLIAAQLMWPALNFDVPWLTYSRLRPLHTNAVIFAFGGSALFTTSYWVVQRTCGARLISDKLAAFTFWGWQAVIVAAAITLPMGLTQGKEYAELEWPIDLLIAVVWVVYAIVFFGTIMKRRVQHIYVANWFYGAFILTVAVLHIVNNISIPYGPMRSYSAYPGAVDAMVQWWYGHNAVGFFLTAGFLGMMYYFVPKQAGRPIYSYRLSIVHFWALISIYMWAGPHHLHYTAIPDWVQSLGMVFSLILLAPSWGGMINGIMTLSGAWHKLREDPIIKFLIVSLSFYGMSTFEGPMMSIKTVNALSHYTDWTIGHVHSGALGWVAMISIGSLYVLIPRLVGKTEMHSVPAINLHFWLSTIGTVLYIAAMWVAGVMQGLMWRAVDEDGALVYTFIESLKATYPFYFIRLLGGVVFLSGMFVMAWNTWKTMRTPVEQPVDETATVPAGA